MIFFVKWYVHYYVTVYINFSCWQRIKQVTSTTNKTISWKILDFSLDYFMLCFFKKLLVKWTYIDGVNSILGLLSKKLFLSFTDNLQNTQFTILQLYYTYLIKTAFKSFILRYIISWFFFMVESIYSNILVLVTIRPILPQLLVWYIKNQKFQKKECLIQF